MPITLNHTIVPSRDRAAGARWCADVFGLPYDEAEGGHFAAVPVNADLTLDFDTRREFEPHHYAFLVDDETFDTVFGRIQAMGLAYGSGPFSLRDGKLNSMNGGRGVYIADPDGHIWELLTRA